MRPELQAHFDELQERERLRARCRALAAAQHAVLRPSIDDLLKKFHDNPDKLYAKLLKTFGLERWDGHEEANRSSRPG